MAILDKYQLRQITSKAVIGGQPNLGKDLASIIAYNARCRAAALISEQVLAPYFDTLPFAVGDVDAGEIAQGIADAFDRVIATTNNPESIALITSAKRACIAAALSALQQEEW